MSSNVITRRRHRTNRTHRTTPEETQTLTGQHGTNPTTTVDGIVEIAKVRVASSNLVIRSKTALRGGFFMPKRGFRLYPPWFFRLANNFS